MPVTDISAIKRFDKLEYVEMHFTNIKSIPDMSDLHELFDLQMSFNDELEDLSYIGKPPKLQFINIKSTNISNIDTLVDLESLSRISIEKTKVSDETIKKFNDRNIELYF